MSSRKLHQTIKGIIDSSEITVKELNYIRKRTGILSHTELVRFCIHIGYLQLKKQEGI